MSATRRTIQTLLAQLLVYAQGLVLTPVVIKVAGPETYGAYVLLASYMGIVFGISSMGVGVSAKRWLPSASDAGKRAARFYPQFWFQLLVVTCLGLVSVGMYVASAEALSSRFHGFSAWLIPAYLIGYTLYSQSTDFFRYTHRVGTYNFFAVAQAYLFVLVAIGVYWVSGTLHTGSLISSAALATAAVGGFLLFRIIGEIGLHFHLSRHIELGKEIRLGFPLMLSFLVDVTLSVADRYVIAFMLSVRDVGMYVPAYTLGSLVLVLPRVFGVVLPPLLSQRIDANDEEHARRLSTGAANFFLLVTIPYVIGAAILGKEVLRLYASDEVADAAWPVVPIVALASVFYGLILIRSNVLFVRLRTSTLFHINLVSAALNILLNLIFLSVFGDVVVAAFAALLSYFLTYLLLSRALKADAADFALDKARLLRALLCAAGMALVILATTMAHQGPMAVASAILVGSATYAGLMLMQRSNREEFALLARSVKRKGDSWPKVNP